MEDGGGRWRNKEVRNKEVIATKNNTDATTNGTTTTNDVPFLGALGWVCNFDTPQKLFSNHNVHWIAKKVSILLFGRPRTISLAIGAAL